MRLQLIRSATLRMQYANQMCLIDPYLAARRTLPSYAGVSPNPLVDLPIPAEQVVAGIDMTIISHLHSDHFDAVAQQILPKDTAIFCQPGDEGRIAAKGFQHVTPVVASIQRQGITLTRVAGEHGEGKVLDDMGNVSGFVLQAEGEPTVYWAGDTIWCDPVRETITRFAPDVIIIHACGAVWGDGGFIVMDAAQAVEVCRAAPQSIVVATHMDSVDHATITRTDLRAFARAAGVPDGRLLIPADGETLTF